MFNQQNQYGGYQQTGQPGYQGAPGNLVMGIVALVAWAVSVAINLYSGYWGVGFYPEAHCPSPKTATAVIWLVYLLVTLALIYAVVTNTWPDQAYWLVIVASILSILSVATRAWWAHSEYSFLRLLSHPIVQFLLLVALFVVLYQLWWTLYQPFNSDWIGLIVRNVIAFWLGWVLFTAVKSLYYLIVNLANWHSPKSRWLLWILELLAFGAVLFTVFQTHSTNGIHSFWGFLLAALIVFVGCLLL